MNKKTFSNYMSIEKKAFKENVAKYAKLNDIHQTPNPTKRVADKDGDPLSFKRPIETELEIELQSTNCDDSMETVEAEESKGDVVSLLKAILDKQNQTFARIANLEARMCNLETTIENFHTWSKENKRSKAEEMARDKMIRECKVLVQKVCKSICRLTGEEQDEPQIDIVSSLPIPTFEAANELEEKLKETEYQGAMKLFIARLKGSGKSFEKIFRQLYNDEFIHHCNWEGRHGKHALIQFSLAADLLYDVCNFTDRKTYDKAMRRCIEKSHHRQTQMRHKKRHQFE